MALAFESRLEEELPWFPIMLFKVTFLRGACGDVVICWVSTQNILGSSKTNVSNSTLKNCEAFYCSNCTLSVVNKGVCGGESVCCLRGKITFFRFLTSSENQLHSAASHILLTR